MANKIIQLMDGADTVYPQIDKGLRNPMVLGSSHDMNQIVVPGIYIQDGASMPSNAPSGANNASIIVFLGRDSDTFQVWISLNSKQIYVRFGESWGAIWTRWFAVSMT